MKKALAASLVWLGVVFSSFVFAAEVTVLSGGAVEPGLHAAVAQFEKQTGHHAKLTFNTTPQIQKRIEAGEAFDIVIVPPAATDIFAKAGTVEAGGIGVGRVGIGVAARPGVVAPDISSVDTLKKSLREADSIVFNKASSGLYVENLLKKLGMAADVEPKSVRYADGASVMEHLLKGKGNEFGFGAMTEILLYKEKGLRLVGPLPAELQNYTPYMASLTPRGKSTEAARELVAFFGTPAGRKLFADAGVE